MVKKTLTLIPALSRNLPHIYRGFKVLEKEGYEGYHQNPPEEWGDDMTPERQSYFSKLCALRREPVDYFLKKFS